MLLKSQTNSVCILSDSATGKFETFLIYLPISQLKLCAITYMCIIVCIRYIQSTCATSGEGLYEGLDWLSNNIANKVLLFPFHLVYIRHCWFSFLSEVYVHHLSLNLMFFTCIFVLVSELKEAGCCLVFSIMIASCGLSTLLQYLCFLYCLLYSGI